MTLDIDRDVLLFFEDRERDTFFPGDRRLRRRLRKATYFLRPGKQNVSGFEQSFLLICRALRRAGRRVHINDFRLARENPDFPVGLCGYPHILKSWNLPNPAVLGPGLFDHPKQAPELMNNPRMRSYIAFCSWMKDLFSTVYDGNRIDLWFGGIDLDDWADTKGARKDIDFLIYDKIRWNRDTLVPALLDPILAQLDKRAKRYQVLRYGNYTHDMYRALLSRSRAMIFVCEHETQGMAYQEALASNVPVLAWDQGFWLDPNRPTWEELPVKASSVPYFGDACGERFTDAGDFSHALDGFLERLPTYQPREWVAQNLSFARSADLYLQAYHRAGMMDGGAGAARFITPQRSA